jgi:hypothetical protein
MEGDQNNCNIYTSLAIGYSATLICAYLLTIMDMYFSRRKTRNKFTFIPLYICTFSVIVDMIQYIIVGMWNSADGE